MELSEQIDAFEALDVGIAAMSYDPVEKNANFVGKYDIPFPMLSDPGGGNVSRIGILNDAYEPGHRWYGIPHPGIMVIDRDGRVYAKFAEEDYRERPALELVLESVREMTGR